jgi:hypothetical protein
LKSGSLAPGPSARSEGLAGILLFHATAGFVLWQNSQVAVLYDLGYLLDTGYRISLGQMPYRDFPLVHAPLTFVIQALIMRLAGRVYLLPVAYAAVVGGLGTVVAWRILLRTLAGKVRSAWAVSLLLAAPLTVLGIHGIYPHPIYDCDCAFAILVAILLLLRLDFAGAGVGRRFGGWPRVAIAGAAVVLPVFFKQNMGLAFLAAVVAGVLLLLLLRFAGRGWPRDAPDRPNPAILPRLLGMIAVASFVAILLIQVLVGLKNYVHWTVRFAAERRLPGWADMLAVYRQPSFVWTLPVLGIGSILLHSRLGTRVWGRILTLCLLAAPFVGSIVFLFLDDDLDERADNLLVLWPFLMIAVAVVGFVELRKGFTLARLMPFFVLAAIHGTFLSQQLWGSTYAIWPLLMVLIAYLLSTFPAVSRWVVPALAVSSPSLFWFAGAFMRWAMSGSIMFRFRMGRLSTQRCRSCAAWLTGVHIWLTLKNWPDLPGRKFRCRMRCCCCRTRSHFITPLAACPAFRHCCWITPPTRTRRRS